MNEIVLINMLSELDPSLLQDNYMEKGLKRGLLSTLFCFLKKTVFDLEMNPSKQPNTDFSTKRDLEETEESQCKETADLEQMKEVTNPDNAASDTPNNRGLSISIFKRNIRNLIKIISGIVAAFLLIIGIIILLIKRHKSGVKLFEKKIQIIY